MIILVTDNQRKFDELRRTFQRYNVNLERIDRTDFGTENLAGLFDSNPKLQAVLDETSHLTLDNEQTHLKTWREERYHLHDVVNRGRMRAWTLVEEQVVEKIYTREIRGWLDYTRPAGDDAFDWDKIFVVADTGLTYEQMRQRGLKNSVRDLVASDFLIDNLYFDHVDLRWSPQNPERTIDFKQDVKTFLDDNPFIDWKAMEPYGLTALLEHVVNDGVFFRAAENRRQRNYWAPGLNGGIPFTPKRDAVHEITFMVHDLMHQAIPDLVFTGIPKGADPNTWRNIYSVWRMISEAFTLVLADMLFVEALVKTDLDYDFSKRKIWPLFDCLDLDLSKNLRSDLRALLYANTRYALAGDDSLFRKIKRADVPADVFEKALTNYQGKYEGYFRADWKWTVTNFDAMCERAPVFERWSKLCGPTLFLRCGLTTLDDVAFGLIGDPTVHLDSLDGVIDGVFELAMTHLEERLERPNETSADSRAVNAARRFMTGQLLLFAAWDVLPNARELGLTFSRTLNAELSFDHVKKLEVRFAANLDDMVERHLISDDDRRTWLGAHPLFEPSYVAYDRVGDQTSLAVVAQECFAEPNRDSPTAVIGDAVFLDLRQLWGRVAGTEIEDRLGEILRTVGAEFYDDRFVKSPVVAICGVGGIPVEVVGDEVRLTGRPVLDALAAQRDMMGYAAFMSYLNPRDKSANEMFKTVAKLGHFSVAHTATLNILIAGHSSAVEHEFACQRDILHLSRLTVARTAAQDSPPVVVADPKFLPSAQRILSAVENETSNFSNENTREFVNQLFPASKASLLLLSGSVRNFQKLIGAKNDQGKEEEFRLLLKRIEASLASLFPELFSGDS